MLIVRSRRVIHDEGVGRAGLAPVLLSRNSTSGREVPSHRCAIIDGTVTGKPRGAWYSYGRNNNQRYRTDVRVQRQYGFKGAQ
jgi:hypothetical protein